MPLAPYVCLVVTLLTTTAAFAQSASRARDLGIPLEGTPGEFNAITDVPGVEVGHATLISGAAGDGSIRIGVTAILPRGRDSCEPAFAGWFAFNGHGEVTGTTLMEQSGFLKGPVMITNTRSIGIVHDAVVGWDGKFDYCTILPVVAETYSILNDNSRSHVSKEHVLAALEAARSGPVAEGNVGGGTGMVCHRFKGGIGTASRVLPEEAGGYTIGVLVQCNYGNRRSLRISGVPVGAEMPEPVVCFDTLEPPPGWRIGICDAEQPSPPENEGSIIIVVATDAPLLPYQLKRLAKRPALGMGRMGAIGSNGSGDIFIAFSTANPPYQVRSQDSNLAPLTVLDDYATTPISEATVQATEEAIINAMLAAETMSGIDHLRAPAISHERVREVMKKYNRLNDLGMR